MAESVGREGASVKPAIHEGYPFQGAVKNGRIDSPLVCGLPGS